MMAPAKTKAPAEEDIHTHTHTQTDVCASPDLNVYQRVSAAKKIVAAYTFSKVKGEGLKFPYLPIDQVKPVVEDAMNKAGLVLLRGDLESVEAVRDPWEVKNDWGAVTYWLHIKAAQEFTWVNIDNPEDRYTQTFQGEAKDNSDKTLSKLYTSIYKNFIKAEFNISDSPKDDIDNTEDEVKAERASARTPARPDPFFNKPAKPKAAEVSETALDRPIEAKIDSITKWSKDPTARLRMNTVAKAEGHDSAIFTEEALKAHPEMVDPLYIAGLKALKGKEAGE